MREPLEVESRTDLASFVGDLSHNPGEWENATLERFLEALSRCAGDLDGWCKNNEPGIDPEKAQWRLVAVALAGAAVYE